VSTAEASCSAEDADGGTGLPWTTVLAYGLPACAIAGPLNFIQFYLLNFATDVLLLAPATVGALLASARVWDALSDPLAGYWSDRTRSRLGRRRPWMFAAAPALALAFAMLWRPPIAASTGPMLAWIGIWLLVFTTAATGWSIPHSALGAELSGAAHVRRRIFGLRFACAIAGIAGAFAAMQSVVNSPEPRAAAANLAGAGALVMAVLLLVPPLAMRERAGHLGRGATHPLLAARDVVANPQARRLLGVWFVDQIGLSAQGAVAPFMAIYVLQRPDLVGVLPACFIVPMILSVPFWIRVAGRYGSRGTWSAAMFGAALAYLPLFGLRADAFPMAAALLGCAGFFSGSSGPLAPALLAAAIDEDAARTRQRKEGVYFAAWNFAEKCSGALVVLSLGAALQLAGFEPNTQQGPAADLAIRACLSLLPAGMFALGAMLLRRLALTEAVSAPVRAP
jgi:Na+/melibiose symporter-like transporter